MASTRAPRSRRLLALLLGGALAIGVGFAAGGGASALLTPAFAGEPAALPPKTLADLRRAPTVPIAPEAIRTCSIGDIVSSPGALDFHGVVVDGTSGETVFERQAADAVPTASVMKLLTVSAALQALGPDYRIPTRVYAGAAPGSVVIVGGGDVTLASTDAAAQSYYSGTTSSLAELAAETRSSWNANPALASAPISEVLVDESKFSGPEWQPSWLQADRTDGYISPISALVVDGGRANPASLVSPRTEDPSGQAAGAFASRLGAQTTGAAGTAPEGAALLAEVWSQPVSELARYALIDSDNDVAEMLARVTAVEQGVGGAFTSIQESSTRALATLGLDTSALVLADGSGLSGDNRVPPEFVASLLQVLAAGGVPASVALADLPASAVSGTLDTRFDPNMTGVAPGAITAKTGWIEDVYALAGYMTAADGSKLTFAFFVVGPVSLANRDVLDSIAAQTYACGASLANW